MIAAAPDLVRLALVPAFLWLALLDVRTRRVPRWVWWPLGAVGVFALIWAALAHVAVGGPAFHLWIVQVAISIGLIAPLGYLFHRFGAFGGADAKAVIVIAIAYPTYPVIALAGTELPLVHAPTGVFSLTVLVNAVLLGLCYPLGIAARNAIGGRFRATMFFGLPAHWSTLESRHGVLLESPTGFTRNGLDLDALRMYLRWRETDLAALRADPENHANPASVPSTPAPAGDGRVRTDGGVDSDDRWGARAFLEDSGGAYGTRPEELRGALDLLCERENVWVSPGIPFLVLLVGGLLVGLVVGDLFSLIGARIGL